MSLTTQFACESLFCLNKAAKSHANKQADRTLKGVGVTNGAPTYETLPGFTKCVSSDFDV
jgi:hypothetical protein